MARWVWWIDDDESSPPGGSPLPPKACTAVGLPGPWTVEPPSRGVALLLERTVGVVSPFLALVLPSRIATAEC